MHTLKEQYKRKSLRNKLKLIDESIDPRFRKLMLEEFDPSEVDQIVKELDNIDALAKKYKTQELSNAAKEASKIAAKLSGLEGKGSQWLAKSLGKLTKGIMPRMKEVFDFTALITKGFKSLPSVLKLSIGKDLSDEQKSNPNLKSVLDETESGFEVASKAIKAAFKPEGFFASLIKSTPFINLDDMILELLYNNSYNDLAAIKGPKNVGFEKEDYQDLIKALKGDTDVLKGFLSGLTGGDDSDTSASGAETVADIESETGLASDDIEKVLAALKKAGKLKEALELVKRKRRADVK
jgi:hypothetical protein